MNRKTNFQTKAKVLFSACTLVAAALPYAQAEAAIIDLDSMYINTITLDMTILSTPVTYVFSPPNDVWQFGSYNGVIVNGFIPTPFGNLDALVESTGAFGASPSTGSVDDVLETINLDFSDIRVTFSGAGTGSFNLYNPATSVITSNIWDPITNDYLFSWTDTNTVTTSLGRISVPYTVTVAGVVPVPAAVWLFGSGLLGLAGVARRMKV